MNHEKGIPFIRCTYFFFFSPSNYHYITITFTIYGFSFHVTLDSVWLLFFSLNYV